MMWLLAFGPLLILWVILCWIVSRPGANYVGTPLTPLQVAMRRLAMNMSRTMNAIGEQLLEAVVRVMEDLKKFAAALGSLPAGGEE